MSARKQSSATNSSRATWSCLGILLVVIVAAICVAGYMAYRAINPALQETPAPGSSSSRDVALAVAYTPEKETLFKELVRLFQQSNPKTAQGKAITISATSMEAEAMIEAAKAGKLEAISPDSSIWLTQLDAAWQKENNTDASLIGETTRYAVSPVVIAMWEDAAKKLGYPGKSIGWRDIMSQAQTNSAFKWSHPATSTASGFLATLAMFYAGSGKTRGLTQEDVLADKTASYVSAVEKTVRYYGEGELAVIQRALQEGPSFLDAFVVQEQMVIYFNRQAKTPGKLIAIYPAEGTLWQDHPLALLEKASLTAEQRQAYSLFRDFMLSREAQKYVLEQGYRPSDLSIPINDAASPISAARGANPTEPQTTLQIPSADVIDVVRQAWLYTKRHANIMLVADVSGSMEANDKLAQAQSAMLTFLDQIKGDVERVGLISFASSTRDVVTLGELRANRGTLVSSIKGLEASGNTALLDATLRAYNQLQALKDKERINAVVVMTDGKENASRATLAQLTAQVQAANKSGVPVIIFCVAYGSDADMNMLNAIATASGGQARRGDPETIKELYKILSTYF